MKLVKAPPRRGFFMYHFMKYGHFTAQIALLMYFPGSRLVCVLIYRLVKNVS